MRQYMVWAVGLAAWLLLGSAGLAENERFAFPELQWEFTVIGEARREVMTPAGRNLVTDGEIQDIRRHGDDVYLVDQYFIRRYDPAQDWAGGEKQLQDVFRFFYQAPRQHEMKGQLHWQARGQWYYPVYFTARKERPADQQVMVFRGLVRIYPLLQETRVQHLPYVRLPEEGQWMAPEHFQNDWQAGRRAVILELENKLTSETRRIQLKEDDSLVD